MTDHSPRTPPRAGWMRRVFDEAAISVRAAHKLLHMSTAEKRAFAKDFKDKCSNPSCIMHPNNRYRGLSHD